MLRSNKLRRVDLARIDLTPPGDVAFPFWRSTSRSSLVAADAFAASAVRFAARSAARSARAGDARFERVGIGVAEATGREAKTRQFWIAVIYAD
jgi:hypothetical protein